MTDYLANSQDAYSRDLIDSLPHSPWAYQAPAPVVKTPEQLRNAAKNLRRREAKRNAKTGKLDARIVHETEEQAKAAQRERNRQFMALKRAATRVNPEMAVDSSWVAKSLRAPR